MRLQFNDKIFKINRIEQVGKNLIALIIYGRCANFETSKLLIYKDLTINELLAMDSIDPFFLDNSSYKTPTCHVAPTEDGWEIAKKIAELL